MKPKKAGLFRGRKRSIKEGRKKIRLAKEEEKSTSKTLETRKGFTVNRKWTLLLLLLFAFAFA